MGVDSEAEDDDFNAMPPAILERLRTIILGFHAGATDEQARAYVEELRGFPDVVRVDASDEAEAELLPWFLRGFSVRVDTV